MEACRLIATELACRRGDRVLFGHLSLALGPGDACRVTGPNGTGKSSLIRILAGLARPFAGLVERTGTAALLDERPALDEQRSLRAALGFWQAIDGGGSDRAEPVAPELGALGLEPLLDVPVRYLSTGQRKRAGIARLLGQRVPLWLLDEPLNGLDTQAAALVEHLVAEHCRAGGMALVASHQPFAVPGMQEVRLNQFAPAALDDPSDGPSQETAGKIRAAAAPG